LSGISTTPRSNWSSQTTLYVFDTTSTSWWSPDGSLASYVGLPYDEHNRYASFEPVCTHPQHLRNGLAQVLMWEALRRVQALGALTASTETARAAAANRLYESIGFTETYETYAWRR
jgi:GNAT superfamily N-acetyltransferase